MPDPFIFYSEYNLPVLLGIKANNVAELLDNIKTVPDNSIYYHTHRFLKQHHYLVPEPPNDFAYWLRNVLNLRELGEHVASINIASIRDLKGLRKRLISVIENFKRKDAFEINCTPGDEFQFMSCKSFVMALQYRANNLREFASIMEKITLNTFYYHIFETQLRKGSSQNDFADWFEVIGENELARKISSLDPYTTTLEGLRKDIIELVKSYDKN